MKKFAVFTVFFVFLAIAGWGQPHYYWTGAADNGLWTDAGNWKTGTFTDTIDGQLVTLTYSGAPGGTIWAIDNNNYFIINDVNGNAVPYPTGSLGIDNLVIQKGSLKLTTDAQCINIIIEGGTLIRGAAAYLKTGNIKMTSGILDLNGTGYIDIPSSGWDITGGIIIRDNVDNYSQPPPTIDDDNVIVIGGPGTGGGGGNNYIWTGGADTDWDNAANWVSGNVPVLGSTIKIIINSSTSPAVNVPSTITCNSFVVADGANFNLNDDLEIYSLLDNKETFNCSSGTVTLIGTTTVKGNNTFYNLDCTNATVKFESGKTQTIINDLTANGADLRAIDNSLPRWNLNVTPANVTNKPASIGECNSTNFLNWSGLVTDSGHNINVFTVAALNTFVWNGTTNTNWTTGTNWVGGTSPGDGDPAYTITIQASLSNPVFAGTGLECDTLIIQIGASLDMGAYNLTVEELDNNGNLILAGGQTLTYTTIVTNETVTYNAAGAAFAGLTSFKNLTIQNGARTGIGAITVSGNFRLEGGSLNAASINVTGTSYIAGNITTTGAQTYSVSGSVTLGGTGAAWILQGAAVTLGLITGDGNSLTINGNGANNANAVLYGGTGINDLLVNGSFRLDGGSLTSSTIYITGTSYIAENITTTSTGTGQTTHQYAGDATLSGTITIQGSGVSTRTVFFNSPVTLEPGADVTLKGNGANTTTVRFGSTVNGAGSITIKDANARIAVIGDLDPITSLTVESILTPTNRFSGNITTTGNQDYYGPILLDSNVIFTADAGSLIYFRSTVQGRTTGRTLAINGADVRFDGTVDTLLISLTCGTISDPIITTINANITTTGAQTYTGSVTLGGGALRTLQGATVTLGTITGAGNSLTITGNGILNGGSDIVNLSVTGDFTLNDSSLGAAAVSITGTSAINQNVTTTGKQTYNGNVTLGGSVPVELTSTGGDVQTNGAVSGAVGITIEADNDIIIGAGGINVPGAVVTLEAGGDITVSGKITGYQLIAKAPNGAVTVDGVEIDLSNTGNEGSSAAIYVFADVFNVTSTSGSIIPGGTGGQLCLVLNTQWTSAGVVDGNEDITGSTPIRWHQHVTIKRDLVYYDHTISSGTITTLFPAGADFVADNSFQTLFTVDTNKNIYIYNVNGSLALTFTASGTGFIEFIGTNNFSDTLTLNTGSGGVRLADTDITLTKDFEISNNEKLTVATDSILNAGASSIKAANISLDDVFALNNEDLTLEAASISINGTVGTSASHLGGVSITSGNITFDDIVYAKSLFVNDNTIINADITTTDDQTYTGKVTLGDDVALTSNSGLINLNRIDGGTHSLTINGDAEFNDEADDITTLHVTGTSKIGADITTTGAQTYTGSVTLGGVAATRTLQGAVVTLGAITGSGKSLTITGDAVLNGGSGIVNLSVTGNFTLNGSSLSAAAVSITGTSGINQNITTTGTQTYTGSVTLGGGPATRTLQGTTVTLGLITGNGNSLTITGNAVLNGGSGIVNLSVIGNSVINQNITTTANQTYDANVTITGTVTLASSGGSFTADGIVSGTTVTVRAAQGISLEGANTLSGNITLENTSSGDITFTNTSATVTLNAENASTSGDIKVDQSGSLVIDLLKTTAARSISIDASGAVTQTGTVETGNLTLKAGTGITLELANKVRTSVELTNTGTGDIEFNNDCTSAGVITVKAAANRDVTITETAGGLRIDEITAAGDITLNVEKGVDSTPLSGKLTGHNIIVNAGGSITLLDITTVSGGTARLNAGYPAHDVFGTPGTVTLTDIDISGDLVIWCMSVDSPVGASSNGTKDVYGKVDLNTDNTTVAGTFLGYFNTISGVPSNNLRSKHIEFGPSQTKTPFVNYDFINSGSWLNTITNFGSSRVYITGTITAADDLTIETESGDIVFEGVYNSNGYDVHLETTGGKIIQNGGSKITAEALNIDSGGAITLAQNNEVQNLTIVSAGGDVEFKNIIGLEISGISAGANAVKITVTEDIDLSSNINASSIEIEADAVTGSGTVAASTGDIKLILDNSAASNLSLARFNAAGTIHVSTKTADIVYYSSVPSATPPASPPSGLWTTPLFVEANSAYNRNVELKTLNTSNNIYLVDVVDTSSKKLTVDSSAGTGTNGFIEFFTTSTNAYKYTGANAGHLELLAGAGGVRIVNAVVDITGNFTINNALTLDGSSASGIKAANITLDRVTAKNNNENLTLEAVGNITVSGKVTVYQLIAIASNGTVTVDEIDIDSSNTGNEGEDAAIYIVADVFVVTTTAPNTINPGGRPAGLQWGQLCLVLSTPWEDIDGVVDGPEDEEPLGTISGARWHQHQKNPVYITGRILYSFTEDSTGNGRLDRIRVQTNVILNGNFSGFDVEIINNEYDINRTKGVNGFQLVSDFTGAVSFDDDSFYIYLTEKPGIDGGNTPLWSVIKNESLMDKSASPSFVGNPAADKNIKPIDTIPPRIAYSLTLPGHPQTYLRMTEPASSLGVDVSASFGGAPVTAQTAEPANLGYLFDLPDSFEIDDLAHLNLSSLTLTKGYFQIDDIVDQGQRTEDLSAVDPDAQPPKYPLNWGYTAYAKVYDDGTAKDAAGASVLLNSVFVPPNKLLTAGMMTKLADGNGDQVTPNNDPVIHRVTDVLVSIAPADGIDNYFAWPVWASPSGSGSGNIFNFDGTAYLERALAESGIELQARINNALTGNLELFWTMADIPAEFRNPEETAGVKQVGGLWLPDILNNPLYYYVSMFPMSGGINLNNTPANNPPLFTYNIAADDLADGSSIKFEFIFRLSNVSDMFAARLDVPNAAAIPHNWYALVRPFAFDIQSIRRQRGGVTILNNVINSNNREVTYLRYHLARPGRVTIQVYTLDGTLVKSLKRNEYRDAGEWTEEWNGTNNGGRPVARGMYFIRVVGPDIDEIRKVMVVK